ncbi:MAG: DUF3179 domain-containing protein [Chitinophagaceae bacterium]|nr:DUF3179 domain-containing protein [Chitinophagaceae bacterium]
MKNKLLLIGGVLLLFIAEILRVYFIMPFPGSQQSNTLSIAYFMNKYIWAIRIIAVILIIFPLYDSFKRWKMWQKGVFIFFMFLYAGIFYMVNFKFLADKMFYQPKTKSLVAAADNKIPSDKLVLGVTINGQSKAYPIEIIGYHHQVQDTIGGEEVIVTYCTVCRTGRVFSPMVKGKKESFRLVGMDHFNAMFEDKKTKSWWRQATGEAVAGKLKGETLKEIPSQQMRLSAWLRRNPSSFILQPDPAFQKQYDHLNGFDLGILNSGLEKRDSGSWKSKSWVIGVEYNNISKAYDWNDLVKQRVINDSLPGLPIVIAIEPDNASFHVWNRSINGQTFRFIADSTGLRDITTNMPCDYDGRVFGVGSSYQLLKPVQASQEFWHSWETFHPGTLQYK